MKRFNYLLLLTLLVLTACRGGKPPAVPPTEPAPLTRPDQVATPPLVFKVPVVETLRLPNGIRLYLKEDHELPLVEVTVMIGAGDIGDAAAKVGQGDLFAATLRSGGAGKRAPAEVDELLEQLAADFSVGMDSYATTLSLSLQSADLETGMALLADFLRRPAFAGERLELARRQQLEGVRRQNDEPQAIAARALAKAIYGDHPLGRSPTEATLTAVNRDDLLDFHGRYFHPDNTWLAISGDFDRIRLLTLLLDTLGDWPTVTFVPQPLPAVTAPARPVLLLADRDLPQSVIQFGQLGIDKSAPDLEAVRVMNYILGGGGFNSRLMREVRSNRGLAYSVHSYFQVGRRLPGPFIAQSETKSASTLEVVQLMRQLMAEMRNRPVTAAELQLAQESLVNSFVFAFNNSHEVVTQAQRLDFYGYPADYLSGFRERVMAVTATTVLAAARERLQPEAMTLVVVGRAKDFAAPATTLGLPVEAIVLP
ncbi:MAG: hypothetical protein A2091_13225 [Desulfuromonadales bacterium GWD2_61_12]|nr:MAG: hypothetical protein A2005_06995 [Desulfuromonadales bacterium GWC2_61_20]OGR34824.1 MAG: hypothetical protein A2091_13225 [Desulfuromonadales bacterium GWD2_61_12]